LHFNDKILQYFVFFNMAPENFAGAVFIDPAVDHARHARDGNLNQGFGMAHSEAAAFEQIYS
jgi:hypothetical protein